MQLDDFNDNATYRSVKNTTGPQTQRNDERKACNHSKKVSFETKMMSGWFQEMRTVRLNYKIFIVILYVRCQDVNISAFLIFLYYYFTFNHMILFAYVPALFQMFAIIKQYLILET